MSVLSIVASSVVVVHAKLMQEYGMVQSDICSTAHAFRPCDEARSVLALVTRRVKGTKLNLSLTKS